MFGYFAVSVLAAFGIAAVLVDKWREWPVRRIHLFIRLVLKLIHPRLPRMLKCIGCTSFWAALPCDFVLFCFTYGHYWAWPLSGFAAFGLSWVIVDFLNAMDKSHVIYHIEDSKPKQDE
jgi:hypothetical protein